MDLAEALVARYPAVPGRSGLYESLYLTAHHPSQPQALWVRHTVLKPAGAAPRASLWCTWFCHGQARAGKVTTADLASTPDRPLTVGSHGWVNASGAIGAVELDSLEAAWDLRFVSPEPPFPHLPKPWMYTAPLPRTKSISAAPMLTLAGSLTVDGQPVDVDGWPCSIGHNWGAEHAERWVWLHADGDSDEGPVWLDVVVGRVRVGPITTPWIANGAISIGGHRHRLGGLRPGATSVTEQPDGATVAMRGKGIRVAARSRVDLPACVAWAYADPAGHTSEVVNSSVARTELRVDRAAAAPLHVSAPVCAFELGGRHRAFDVPLQPFPD